jgi:hypothetical protein
MIKSVLLCEMVPHCSLILLVQSNEAKYYILIYSVFHKAKIHYFIGFLYSIHSEPPGST